MVHGKGQFSFQSQRKGNNKEYSNCRTIVLSSHANKVMFKILQARLQQYVNWDLPDVQAGFRKGRGPEIKLSTFTGSYRKQGNSTKHILLLHWLCKSLWLCESQETGKFWEMGIPDHLPYLLRNLYAGQEATVRAGHETIDWFQMGKGVHHGCILSPCSFNLM